MLLKDIDLMLHSPKQSSQMSTVSKSSLFEEGSEFIEEQFLCEHNESHIVESEIFPAYPFTEVCYIHGLICIQCVCVCLCVCVCV